MSLEYSGNYTKTDTFNAAKRYKLKFQKNVRLADIELSELNQISDSFVRQLVSANFPTGSTINNGFKIVESTTPTNNFTIKGGNGTVNGAGVLFVDGYILFLRNDIEYMGQDTSGNLTDDDYSKTTFPELTTPTDDRTDEIYVDFYFAEVSGTSGSEYEDPELLISGIDTETANRLRMVQDIRVAEGGTTPINGNDLNGIYHWYIKIATINRLGGNASITNAMITDNRILVNSNYSYMNGTAGTIKLVDGADIGDSTHRISNIYVNSNIDYKNALTFINSSSGEKICFTTDGKIGIGTTNPGYQLQLSTDSAAKPSTNTWTVASDIRVKKNVEDFTKYGLEDLLKLRPITFEYNGLGGFSDDGKKHVGYIAQEVEQIIPEMVSSVKSKLKAEDEEEVDLKNVNTHLLSFAIIEALREMKKQSDEKDIKISDLEKTISEMLIRIKNLESK